MSASQKMCGNCQQVKPAGDFHKRAASNDGLSARCKMCQRKYDAARRDDPDRVAQRTKNRPKYKHLQTSYNRKWGSENPEKYAPHITLNNAVRDGKILKGLCEACGSKDVEAHHDDYSKHLEVRWLCTEHHGLTRRID